MKSPNVKVTKNSYSMNDLKYSKSHYILFDDDIKEKIQAEGIEFGIVFKDPILEVNPISISIIKRNGFQSSQIDDRSLSKIITGIKFARRRKDCDWWDYRKSSYEPNTQNMYTYAKTEKSIDQLDFNNLSEEELIFFIKYVNIELIRKQIFNSNKFKSIQSKI